MIEYTDGQFGEIAERNEILKKMTELFDSGQSIKAVHFGTRQQLESIRDQKVVEDRIATLEEKIKKLESDRLRSDNIIIPSRQDVRVIGALFNKR